VRVSLPYPKYQLPRLLVPKVRGQNTCVQLVLRTEQECLSVGKQLCARAGYVPLSNITQITCHIMVLCLTLVCNVSWMDETSVHQFINLVVAACRDCYYLECTPPPIHHIGTAWQGAHSRSAISPHATIHVKVLELGCKHAAATAVPLVPALCSPCNALDGPKPRYT
jgi:hypothetical protein